MNWLVLFFTKKRESGANWCSWNIGSEKKVDTADVQRGDDGKSSDKFDLRRCYWTWHFSVAWEAWRSRIVFRIAEIWSISIGRVLWSRSRIVVCSSLISESESSCSTVKSITDWSSSMATKTDWLWFDWNWSVGASSDYQLLLSLVIHMRIRDYAGSFGRICDKSWMAPPNLRRIEAAW